jgi:hypothetical protein
LRECGEGNVVKKQKSASPYPPVTQSLSLVQMVSEARHGVRRCMPSSAKYSSAHARYSESHVLAHTAVFGSTPARGSHTEHSSAVQACTFFLGEGVGNGTGRGGGRCGGGERESVRE